MADLTTSFAGIRSPNPFWLASGPPTNTGDQVMRAFDAGWGGAVWKTIGEPIVNVSSRYGGLDLAGQRVVGFNNIELITDRPMEVNFREIALAKKRYPKHAVIASLMVESKREAWHDVVARAEDAGADGLELNFGCPHGMSERGMGAAVGQVPEYCARITGWVKEKAKTPVIVKLTPNVTDVTYPAKAAIQAGADGLSLINTINSLMSIDLESFAPAPAVRGQGSHGGYCGPAVKPIALNMVGAVCGLPEAAKIPVSGIGGIASWRDAAEFIAVGAQNLQVCTAVMHHGFRVVEDLIDGLSNYLDEHRLTLSELRGKALPNVKRWEDLDLNYKVVAAIDYGKCIGCQLCYIACNDGAHQAIGQKAWSEVPAPPIAFEGLGPRSGSAPVILEENCVGCNLCSLVCPVPGCIEMQDRSSTGQRKSFRDYQTAGETPHASHRAR